MTLYIISFGSDARYEALSYEVIRAIQAHHKKSFPRIYTRQDLPSNLNDYARRFKRGYGYWAWKPYVLMHSLDSVQDGDTLLYVDGRCGIRTYGQPIHWLDRFMEGSEDIAAWRMCFIESHWTTADILSSLGQNLDSEIANTGQYAATFFALRIGQPARQLIHNWARYIQQFNRLCRDEPCQKPNHPLFKENRHDQSAFSVLLKIMQAKGAISPLTLSDEDVHSDNLIPHQHKHPRPPESTSIGCTLSA